MPELSYHTAGESHGPALTALVHGLPAGLDLDLGLIDGELRRRQGGYGRGGRQKIETDAVTFLAGVRRGHTTGAPVVMQIPNKDSRLDDLERTPPVYRPRPGHADLAGSIKWLTTDCRETLERASARDGGPDCGRRGRPLHASRLRHRDVRFRPRVARRAHRGGHRRESPRGAPRDARRLSGLLPGRERHGRHDRAHPPGEDRQGHRRRPGRSARLRLPDRTRLVRALRSQARCASRRCGDGHPGVQGGRDRAREGLRVPPGSEVHDPIAFDPSKRETPSLGYVRSRNNAGGLEGGMTNGMPIIVTGTMKPISTLLRGMPSVNLNTKTPEHSDYERSDVCALSAASVVMENVVAFEVARAFVEKFGGDTMTELRMNYDAYLDAARRLPLDPPEDAAPIEAEQTEA